MKRLLALLAFAAAASAQPVVTAVLDGAALTNNIAQGSVFVVKGTGLSSTGYVPAPAPLYPKAVNGISISLTAVSGGAVVTPLMVYTYNVSGVNQLAAVVPSTTPVGAYDLKVINGAATSAAFRTSVVARKPGIVTASSDGLGPAQATLSGQLILQRNSNVGKIGDFATRSAHLSERIDLWGTGLGPDVASDTGGTSGDQTVAAQIRVLVDGTEVTPAYAGRSQGYPGLDQIVFTLPASTPLSCTVDIQVRAGDVLSNPVTIATSTADTCTPRPVRINEVESNGGTPGDWVELYNTSTAAVNISGFSFKDNDDTHNYLIPAGTNIPAGGYFLLEEAAFTFGLGSPDSARLYDTSGALADSYSWTPHAATTYGRCPNATGVFATTTTSTKGAANDCSSPIKINEVESSGGTPGDWVELFNPTTAAVNISGFVFRDNDDSHTYTIPAGTSIAAGGYYLLEEADFVFGLGSPDAARLFDTNGNLVDSYSWTPHATTTYGRCPNGTGGFATTNSSTKGAANDCAPQVKINEVESDAGTPGDWVEIYNPGTAAANLSGFIFRDNDDTHSYVIPSGTNIAAGGYLVLDEAVFGFGLGSADSARLFDTSGTLVDSYSWTAHAATTYGRCPNGTGAFATTATSTKGAANNCAAALPTVHINEVESNGGTPGDWFELINVGTTAADLSGWKMLDNDDTHTPYVFPAGSTIAPGGYLVVEEAQFVFGLGAPDSVRIYDATGAIYETYSWTAHATTTYGRCPNGTGTLVTTTSATKGAANDCGNPVKINEVESDAGTPGDWVELYNPSAAAVDISGFIFKDNDDTHSYAIPAGTSIAAGGYLVLDEANFGFGLGSADSARLFDTVATLIDSYSWAAHATTTYGRCPNGTGAFVTTTASTKGTANACPGDVNFAAWPGGATIQIVDGMSVFGGNLSGLVYEAGTTAAQDVMWGARNGPGSLFRLVFNGTIWTPDPTNNWGSGKALRYPNGTGDPDAEGVTYAGTGSSAGIFLSTERDNSNSGVSRPTVLRVDPAAAGAVLTATAEWNLTADLPVVGPNLGIEGITWIPDTFLVSKGFFDESKNHLYNPGDYANHGTGIFFVGLEANGNIYGYALEQSGTTFTRVATITTGLTGVRDLQFDKDLTDFWGVCDDTCNGRSVVMRIDAATGKFTVARRFERPTGMQNLNNEGFAITPATRCVNGNRPVYWSDDSETDGHAIRSGTLTCTAF